MNVYKRTGRVVGLFFITATVAGILGMVFSAPLQAADYLASIAGNENQVIISSILTLVMGVAVAGIAISSYPVLRKFSEGLALGYVGARIVEAVMFIFTVFSWLLLVVLSREFIAAGSPDGSYFQTLGEVLMAVGNWAGHVILDLIVSPIHYLIFYYLLFKSKLVPRWLSIWGLIGVPFWLAAGILGTFSHNPTSSIPILLNLPIAINEMVLAVWLIIKGFNPVGDNIEK